MKYFIASLMMFASAVQAKTIQICGYNFPSEMVEQSYNAEPANLTSVMKEIKAVNQAIAEIQICATGVDKDLKENLVAVIGLDQDRKPLALQQFYYLNDYR